MRSSLVKSLICPSCPPRLSPLVIEDARETGGEIAWGTLACPACASRFAIRGGIADLRPAPPAPPDADPAGYESQAILAAYLWSHYADWWDDPEAGAAYAAWTGLIAPGSGETVLDAGCAVGRLTLEAAARCELAVGVDLSLSFIRAARTLATTGELRFFLPLEGRIGRETIIRLPERLRGAPAEFLLADVQALPFRNGAFQAAASCNIVDKVPRPLAHLRECQRVIGSPGRLLLCDPFSWSEEAAPVAQWLGGTPETGPALARIPQLLEETPGWKARADAPVPWTIRHHANRFERIFSQTILAAKA